MNVSVWESIPRVGLGITVVLALPLSRLTISTHACENAICV